MDKNYLKAMGYALACITSTALMIFIMVNAIHFKAWAIASFLVMLGIGLFLAVTEAFYAHFEDKNKNETNT